VLGSGNAAAHSGTNGSAEIIPPRLLAADEGRIYFFSEEGKHTVVAADREFKKLAENQLGDRFHAAPAASGKGAFFCAAGLNYIGSRIEQGGVKAAASIHM